MTSRGSLLFMFSALAIALIVVVSVRVIGAVNSIPPIAGSFAVSVT